MSDSEEDVALERQIKISVVGEPATGKSLLCSRYLGLQCSGVLAPTQGAEILVGDCPVHPHHPRVPLKLCDIAGTALNTPMLNNYLYASDVIILMYDITNLLSFDRLSVWLDCMNEIFRESSHQPLLAIFGNKCDMEHQRSVKIAHAQIFGQENSLIAFTGSARTGENVNSAIISLTCRALGMPITKSLFNSTIVRAELGNTVKSPQIEKKVEIDSNIQQITNKNSQKLNEKITEKEKELIKKKNRKAIREIRMKTSSAVCSLQ